MIKRKDGTFVISLNGMDYHVTEEDPLYAECKLREAEAEEEKLPTFKKMGWEDKRKRAYAVTDKLKNEIEFDYISQGKPVDYSKWVEAVKTIKLKYPKE